MSNPLDLTPEEHSRLRELGEALRSEFHASEEKKSSSSPLQDLEDLKPDFLGALQFVLKHSDSETLRAKVAMWGYDRLLEQGKASADPIAQLLEGMERITDSS